MPIGEVRIGDRTDTNWMRRILDVEEQAVALTRAAGQTDRRIDSNVVTLGRPGVYSRRPKPLVEERLKCGPQRGAVSTRCSASPAASLDQAVEQRPDEARPEHEFLTLNCS